MEPASPTPGVSGERWALVFDLFESVVDLPGPERSRLLDEKCTDDKELRAEVERLLQHHRSAGAEGFLAEMPGATRLARDAERLAGSSIGPFRIVRLIASGGMGSVFEAEQQHPRRTVAVKVLKPVFAAGRALRRFQFEVDVLARLRHPGIAQIFEAGTHRFAEGPLALELPWYAMEYLADACTITEFADRAGLDARQRIRLFLHACEAVHHAHQRGVIHRDLKPMNLLVGPDGQPKVIDFGIARAELLEGASVHTLAGDVLGTPRFMAPEQAAGSSDQVDVRTDVYALGVILFELLCGAPPLDCSGLSLQEALEAVRTRSHVRPRIANPALPRPLEWLLDTALAKQPARRYPSVADLAADLQRYLAHQPLSASPPDLGYRARTFARRNRIALGVGALLLLLASGWIVSLERTLARAKRAERELTEALQVATLEVEKKANVLGLIEFAVDQARTSKQGADVTFRDVLLEASRVVGTHGASMAVDGEIASTLAEFFHGLGEEPLAEEWARKSLTYIEQDASVAPGKVRGTYRLLATALLAQGKLAEADQVLKQSPQGLPDPEHYATEDSFQHTRATLLVKQGQYGAAIDALRALLATIEGRNSDPNRALPAVKNLLAIALCNRGEFDEAEALASAALAEFEAAPTLNPLQPALVRGTLGLIASERGDRARAEEILRGALAEVELQVPKEHPYAISGLANLGWCTLASGRCAEAHALALELAARLERSGAPAAADRVNASRLLGEALIGLGRCDEAEPILSAALADAERGLSPIHPARVLVLASTGRCRALLDRGAEASAMLYTAAAALDGIFGADHPRARQARSWLEEARRP